MTTRGIGHSLAQPAIRGARLELSAPSAKLRAALAVTPSLAPGCILWRLRP